MFLGLSSLWQKRFRRRVADGTADESTRRLLKNDPSFTHLVIHGEQVSEDSLMRQCLALKDNRTVEAVTLKSMHLDKSWLGRWLLPSLRNKKGLALLLEDCSDDDDSTLAEALTECRYLRSIIIRGCDFEPSRAWGKILRSNRCLTELRICYSHSLFADYDGEEHCTMTSLSEGLACNESLRILNLSGNGLCDGSLMILIRALATAHDHTNFDESQGCTFSTSSSLTHLSLDLNALGDGPAKYLAQLLSALDCCMMEMSLFGNRITDLGADALAKSLYENTSLTTLNLGLNQIENLGASTLANVLTVNATLQNLSIPSNRIGFPGLQTWGDRLPHMRGLKHLNLGMILDQACTDALCHGLRSNVQLSSLHMELAGHDEQDSDDSCVGRSEIDFWLRLNRSGRRAFLRNDADLSKPTAFSQAPAGLCAKILAKSVNFSPCMPDVLFYMLKEKPEVFGG